MNEHLSKTHCHIINEIVDVFNALLDAPEYINEFGKWINTENIPLSAIAGFHIDSAFRTDTLLTCCVNFGSQRFVVKMDLIPELIGTGTIRKIATFKKDKKGNPQLDIVNTRPHEFAF